MPESGPMVSREVPQVPDDPKQMRKFLEKILRDHYRDISALFLMTTDTDLFEKKQRDLQG